jgi:DNA-binding MarR family transcriptional regulator
MSSSNRDEYLSDAELDAWHGMLQFTSTTTRALDEALSASHGISVKEFDVLITLFNAPDSRLRMSALAERVLLSASGVTHLVTRLERDGLVQRLVDEDDRRSFFAELTPLGQDTLRRSRPTHNEVVREHLTHRLTPNQLTSLGGLIQKVLEA